MVRGKFRLAKCVRNPVNMSEGADSVTPICENSLTTLKVDPEEVDPEKLPPRIISHNTRRPRFGIGNAPLSPYILIDGKKLRSSLAFSKRRPPRRVSFPANDNLLVTGCLEPANPWRLAENVNRDDLISAYKDSCTKHNTDPLEVVISQLQSLDTSQKHSEQFNLRGQTLDPNDCEALEEILKRIQFDKVDLEATSLNDQSSVILFDMLEYYESAKQLIISSNQGIGVHGWHACANLIRKTQCLEHLEAKDITLNEQYMNILSRALRLICNLHVLKLENCGLSGRSTVTLVAALKMNTGIRELYLADNGLNLYDAIQLGSLLRFNNHIQLLDISNNNIQDNGVRDILEGLINQINEDKSGKGLSILVLWNNQLTKKSAPYFARIITLSKTLETLNIGKNVLTDDLILTIKDALMKNHTLLQLGIQSTELTCDGIVALSEIIETNQILQRIDLRNNDIRVTGLSALNSAMKKNKSITKIDFDLKLRTKVDDSDQTLYTQLLTEIQVCCSENEQNRIIEETSEGSESSHHSILCSTNSRKISLTCQTLPCSLSTVISIRNNEQGQTMLEPKRINGGRLRSPALSPASSPIASPIPSPSRSRFVVSRVPETSLCSTDSSASTSPVTLSLESSTYLASSASGPSRFRVSVVESAKTIFHKPVVASSKADITFDVKFKVNSTGSTVSDDSVGVFGSKLETSNAQSGEQFRNGSGNVSHITSNKLNERCTPPTHEFVTLNDEQQSTEAAVKAIKVDHSAESVILENMEHGNVQNNHINISTRLESTASIKHIGLSESYRNDDSKDSKTSINVNKDDRNSTIITNNKPNPANKQQDMTKSLPGAVLNERTESQAQTRQKSCIQKHTPNLEKLLALFQQPSCLFPTSQLKSKSTFQDTANNVTATESKFHGYLNEDKNRSSHQKTEDSSESPKSKLTKSFNISQILSLKSLTNMFPSFKFDGNLNVSEQTSKSYSKPVTEVNLLLREKSRNADYSNDNKQLKVHVKGQEINLFTVGNRLVPEEIQSKSYVELIKKNFLLPEHYMVSNIGIDNCLKIANNNLLTRISENKLIVPLSKFVNRYKCPVLKATISNVKIEDIEKVLSKVDSIMVKTTCDKTLTDSINFTSDSSSLSCNIMYDITNINDTFAVNMSDKLHNLVILNLNARRDLKDNFVFNIDNKQNNLACFMCKTERGYNISNESFAYQDAFEVNLGRNCLNNEVTKCIDTNYRKEACTNVYNTPSNEVKGRDVCRVNNSTDWQSISVSGKSKARISKKNYMYEDINLDSSGVSADSSTSSDYKEEVISTQRVQKVMKPFDTTDKKYLELYDDNVFMEDSMSSMLEKTDVMPVSRTCSCIADFDKSIPKDLIFYIADISSLDESSIEEKDEEEEEISPETIPNEWSNDAVQPKSSFYNLSQSNRTMNLIIEEPENICSTNEVSKIEEKNFSTSHNVQDSTHFPSKEEFQESNESGINESECSSICTKVYSIAHPKKDVSLLKKSSDIRGNTLENIYMFTKFGSNIAQRVKFTNPNAISDMTQKYLNTIKCAVATTMCSKAAANTRSNMRVEVISDESTTVAESSSVIHATSTK
ncbi:PREDICTED: uncharacterized protein LOC107185512 [Dufourea novaeangliae]|uniref:uncharacterized protein LOC107185512 n=1 Tax=Dufourea novaeangliae TaxID=178035 RepID=UPI000767B17D|nr:PREDICTED: uncharacterized protein LOC107185512 [Dufourea novaeangliae]